MITTLIKLENYLQDSEIISNAILYVSDSTLTYSFNTQSLDDEELIPQLVHMYCVYTLIANKADDVEFINELQYLDIDDYYKLINKLDTFFINTFEDINRNTDKTINNEIVYKLFKYLYIELNAVASEYYDTQGTDINLTAMIEFINTTSETFNFNYEYAFFDSFSGVYNETRKPTTHKYKVATEVDKTPKFSIAEEDKVDTQISDNKQISDTPKAIDKAVVTQSTSTNNDVLSSLHTDMQLIKAMLVAKDTEEISDKKIEAIYNVLIVFNTSVDKNLIKQILELNNRL
jgi:hypothetical protein